ncbi:MAG: 3-phosphoshikimate 1-carboxyvinyltransferase [Chlamydiota bacterium]|nr:3-phosphoshikimate 1-carboxyvinyltransferase [Chlamydiota bacterium]
MHILPATLRGRFQPPPSKSHTLRALLFAALAEGKSRIRKPLLSPDTEAMVAAIEAMGASVDRRSREWVIEGGHLSAPRHPIDAGNSGQVLRFIGAIASLCEAPSQITGDESIRCRRPLLPLVEGIRQCGGRAWVTASGHAPLFVEGPRKGGDVIIEGEDSQPISALLIASALAEGVTHLYVGGAGEHPWVDLTLAWMTRLGLSFRREGYAHYVVPGGQRIAPFVYEVPADWSSASYPLAMALIGRTRVMAQGVDLTHEQGDAILIDAFQAMGGVCHDLGNKKIEVRGEGGYYGQVIDLNRCIDALPLLAVMGCFAQSPMRLFNGAIARRKESNRMEVIAKELRKMGAKIRLTHDTMEITPTPLKGAHLQSHEDHRIAMALTVAACGAETPSFLEGHEAVIKSYPHFFATMESLGARLT